jgi:Tfp pilus assembly major pilin PilA
VQADVLPVMTDLRNKDYDNAFVATEALTGKMTNSPVADDLKGAAQFGKGTIGWHGTPMKPHWR